MERKMVRAAAGIVFMTALLLVLIPAFYGSEPGAVAEPENSPMTAAEVQSLAQKLKVPNRTGGREIGVTESILNNDRDDAISVHYPLLGLKQADKLIKTEVDRILADYQSDRAGYLKTNKDLSSSLLVDYSSYLVGDRTASILFTVEKDFSRLAHPDQYVASVTIDLREEKLLSLDDILKGEYLKMLSQKTRDYFAAQDQYRDLVKDSQFLQGTEPIAPNFTQFALRDEALTLWFQKYQLFPGIYGMVSLDIPYSEMKDYLKIETGSQLITAAGTEPFDPAAVEPAEALVVDKDKPMIALTFDDGPSNKVTPRILDTLKANNARATFFVVGNRVDSYAEVLRREYEEGHEIGNHTYNHPSLIKLKPAEVTAQAQETDSRVARLTSFTPQLIRPPYGAYNDLVKKSVAKPFVLWSVDTLDWKSKNKDAVIKAVMGNVRDGDIILMHDLYGSTADACEVIIPELTKQGFQFVTVSELLDEKEVKPVAGTVYNRITGEAP